MKYTIDCEFSEAGPRQPVTLISIGLTAEDGREFYAVSSEFKDEDCNEWVRNNVVPHLGDQPRQSLAEIRKGIFAFIGSDVPEFWGWYAAYDWVIFCQIFGSLNELPKGWPMFIQDICQELARRGNPRLDLSSWQGQSHRAVDDSRRHMVGLRQLGIVTKPRDETDQPGNPWCDCPFHEGTKTVYLWDCRYLNA